MEKGLLQVHDTDDVAVASADLRAGESWPVSGGTVTLLDDIPFGHKVALRDIAAGENVMKYGAPIGHAAVPIRRGEHIHTHNLKTNLSGLVSYTYQPDTALTAAFGAGTQQAFFDGYPRPDGRAGVRNELWIIPTVGCVNTTALRLAELAREKFGGRFDDVRAFPHTSGCSQLGDDQANTMRLLAGLIHSPNAGAVLVVSLGCENNNLDVFRPYLGQTDPRRIRFLVTQEAGDELAEGMELLASLSETAGGQIRQKVPLSQLTVGFKCGGSDAFSGLTANVLCGRLNDRIVRCGGSTILTEVPEMFGAETLLMSRCRDQATFQRLVEMIDGYKNYFTRHGQPICENPSPGNKKGGISTLEEKSLGCVQKGGTAPVEGVLNYGEAVTGHGLHLLTGSGNDQVSCTNLTASGAAVICFTTGRGTPFGAPVPTVKLASNSSLAGRKPGWIDFNAGRALEGESFDALAEELFQNLLELASGRKRARNEENGFKEIALFRDGVIL